MVEEISTEEKVVGPTVYAFHKINSLIRDQLNVILVPDNDDTPTSRSQLHNQDKTSSTSFVASKNMINSSSSSSPSSQFTHQGTQTQSSRNPRRSSSISPKSRRRRQINNTNNNNDGNLQNAHANKDSKSFRRKSSFLKRSKLGRKLRHYWTSFLSFVELFICDVILTLLLPIIAPLITLNFIWRWIISTYYKVFTGGKIKLMRGEDAFWAFESPANPGNFTSMYVIRGVANLQKIRERLTSAWINAKDPKSGRPLFAKLKCKAVKLPCGYFGWEHCGDNFDVNSHIRYLNPLYPNTPTSESALFSELSRNYDVILPSNKPQWEILIVPHYIYNSAASTSNGPHYAIVFRIHHSIMDGLSAAQVLRILVADEFVPAGVDPMKPIKSTWFQRIVLYTTALFMTGPYLLRQNYVKEESSKFWSKDGLQGPKVLSWSRPIRMEAIKKIRESTKSSVSAIFSSVTGAALNNFSIRRGFGIPQKVTAASCAALIPYPSLKAQNRFCVLFTPLPVGRQDEEPFERVRQAHDSSKHSFFLAAEVVMAYWITWVGGCFPVWVNNWLQFGICQATTLLSNLPGPQKSTKIFGGDVIQDIVGWSPIRNRIGNYNNKNT